MPLCDDPYPAGGVRASGRQHPVERRDAGGGFCLLSVETTCSQPGSDYRLVAAHRRFDQRASTIVWCFLPGQSAFFRDHLDMSAQAEVFAT